MGKPVAVKCEGLRAHSWPGMMKWGPCTPTGLSAGYSVPAGRDVGDGVQGGTRKWNGIPAILRRKGCPEEVGWRCGLTGRGLASHAQSLVFEPLRNQVLGLEIRLSG